MKIKCLHGYFIFEEMKPGDCSKFIRRFGFDLVPKDGYFTFADLEDAPSYSIFGNLYLNAPTLETFAGNPWDVMRQNKLVYNFSLGTVVSIFTILQRFEMAQTGSQFISSGLILPGSLNIKGQRVTDYMAWFSWETLRFRYSEVTLD